MNSLVDFTPAILSSLQDKLDVAEAFPVVYTMTPQTLELFVGSVMKKLNEKMNTIMQEGGESYIANDDALGLSLLLMRGGVKLPPDMLLDICADIIKKSRRVAKWIMPTGKGVPGQEGGVWHCKMYINLNQSEDENQA
jgi:hypothetical protein